MRGVLHGQNAGGGIEMAVPRVSSAAAIAHRIDQFILAATLAFSLTVMTILAHIANEGADRRRAVGLFVYGATLVGCALSSFLYHVLASARGRTVLRYIDHAAIFLLIAGTYTPFASDELRGPFGFSILGWVWALASLGVMLKLLLLGACDRAFVGLYLGIGWFIVAGGRGVIAAITPLSLALLVLGGLVYTTGAIVYAYDRGHWMAPIWHACVLIGALAHFLAVVAL